MTNQPEADDKKREVLEAQLASFTDLREQCRKVVASSGATLEIAQAMQIAAEQERIALDELSPATHPGQRSKSYSFPGR